MPPWRPPAWCVLSFPYVMLIVIVVMSLLRVKKITFELLLNMIRSPSVHTQWAEWQPCWLNQTNKEGSKIWVSLQGGSVMLLSCSKWLVMKALLKMIVSHPSNSSKIRKNGRVLNTKYLRPLSQNLMERFSRVFFFFETWDANIFLKKDALLN